MVKIKVNIDKPDPPKRVIHKHKNFNNFMDSYHKFHTQDGIREMWYRDKKTLAYIAIAVVFILLMLFSKDENPENNQDNTTPKTEQEK
ncbi:hypothetical protein [Flexithrix dorotheae]|uniref:hypothetical protein n=1 Tax=Flexithrix dorotheae TaxID=70993 RepID=UPI000375B8DB|nr:hypothetical protein [Flexithrix dorotheae]